jgi:hypothetical protein
LGSSYYRGCWHEVSKPLFIGYYHLRLSPIKAVYVPKDFFLHAASLDQAFAHCRRFSTAATRRCMALIAVPLVGVALSRPLAVIALVGFYPANKLIARRLFPQRPAFQRSFTLARPSDISPAFAELFPSVGQITYVLLPRLPLSRFSLYYYNK